MFTVGLFSTHIPYIAFVFFYAFFFLFGIQKAHAGELSGTEKVSVVASYQITETEDEACISYFSTFCANPVKKNISPPVTILKLLSDNALPEISIEFDFSRFSRPPPAA
jgi:hypothetical protein